MKNLTKMEQYYFNVMASGNVLFLKAKPATAKSSILRSIAEKTGRQYIDIRLTTADETDFSIPSIIRKDGLPITECSIPSWALKANSNPTIIHFEEINVCRKEIQDAALGIFLERIVGEYKLNDDVYICTSGNLGEEDGTHAEDLSSALMNRMVVTKHELPVDYWVENFANDNVHRDIVSFIKATPEYFYRKNDKDNNQYATCRSWFFLSNYIQEVYGKNAPFKEWKDDVSEHGYDFVGSSCLRLIRYMEEQSVFNITDIINNYSKVRDIVLQSGRAKLDELLISLKDIGIDTLNENSIKNVIKFLKDNHENADAVGGYLESIINSITVEDMEKKEIKLLLSSMKEYAKVIQNALNV